MRGRERGARRAVVSAKTHNAVVEFWLASGSWRANALIGETCVEVHGLVKAWISRLRMKAYVYKESIWSGVNAHLKKIIHVILADSLQKREEQSLFVIAQGFIHRASLICSRLMFDNLNGNHRPLSAEEAHDARRRRIPIDIRSRKIPGWLHWSKEFHVKVIFTL
jgi:hypothetical protein